MLPKRLLNASFDGDRAATFLAEAIAQQAGGCTDDSKECVQAFIGKRPSDFRGLMSTPTGPRFDLPAIEPETQRFWDATKRGRLMLDKFSRQQ